MSDKQLWCAVIQQAITDATEPLSTRLAWRRNEQLNAREWLTKPNKDFNIVCSLAGLEPMRVRTYAIKAVTDAAKHDQPIQPTKRRTNTSPGVGQNFAKDRCDRSPRVTQETV